MPLALSDRRAGFNTDFFPSPESLAWVLALEETQTSSSCLAKSLRGLRSLFALVSIAQSAKPSDEEDQVIQRCKCTRYVWILVSTLELQSCVCCSHEKVQILTKGKWVSFVTPFLLCMGRFPSLSFAAGRSAVDKMPLLWVRCLKGLNAIVLPERSQGCLARLHA